MSAQLGLGARLERLKDALDQLKLARRESELHSRKRGQEGHSVLADSALKRVVDVAECIVEDLMRYELNLVAIDDHELCRAAGKVKETEEFLRQGADPKWDRSTSLEFAIAEQNEALAIVVTQLRRAVRAGKKGSDDL